MNKRIKKVLEKVIPQRKVIHKNDGGGKRIVTDLDSTKSNIPTITYYNCK